MFALRSTVPVSVSVYRSMTIGSRQVAVEQDAHERLCRWRDQRLLGELQDSDRMLAGDGWKFVQELVERMASFQVVDQILHRDASAREYRRASQALGRGSDQRVC